jgi:hypothetical protein
MDCALRNDFAATLGAEFAIRSADAQPRARLAVFDRVSGEFVGVDDEGNP